MPSRTRARNTRTRTTDPLARFARSFSRGRRGRRVYLVHRAVVAYVSRAPRAAIRPHCSALPAPCRFVRCASRRRWDKPSDTPPAPLPRPHYALSGCRPPFGRLHIVYRLSRCVARSLRSLAIARSSRRPCGVGVLALPGAWWRQYARKRVLITDAGLPAGCCGRSIAGAPAPLLGACAPCVAIGAASLRRPDGRCPPFGRANRGLRPAAFAPLRPRY